MQQFSTVELSHALNCSTESAQTNTGDASGPSSGVAKPTGTERLEASVLLKNMTDLLSSRGNEIGVKKLLPDTAKLRAWQNAVRPTNNQRDAMMKLGSDWQVPQKVDGKKRKPADVAKDLEKEFIGTAGRLLENKSPFGGKRGDANPAHEYAGSKRSKGCHDK